MYYRSGDGEPSRSEQASRQAVGFCDIFQSVCSCLKERENRTMLLRLLLCVFALGFFLEVRYGVRMRLASDEESRLIVREYYPNNMIIIDLKPTWNADYRYLHRKHWSHHNSSETLAILDVKRNGKRAKILCSMYGDWKALAHLVSSGGSGRLGNDHGDNSTDTVRNRAKHPHHTEQEELKTEPVPWITTQEAIFTLLIITAVELLRIVNQPKFACFPMRQILLHHIFGETWKPMRLCEGEPSVQSELPVPANTLEAVVYSDDKDSLGWRSRIAWLKGYCQWAQPLLRTVRWALEWLEWLGFLELLHLPVIYWFQMFTEVKNLVTVDCAADQSRFRNKKMVMLIRLLALLFLFLVFGGLGVMITNHCLESRTIGTDEDEDTIMFTNFRQSHGSLLVSTDHVSRMIGNAADVSVVKNLSDEFRSEMYFPRHGQYVTIIYNLTLDEKALLAPLMSTDQSGKVHRRQTTEIQNTRDDRSHLQRLKVCKKKVDTLVIIITIALSISAVGIVVLVWCKCGKERVQTCEQIQDEPGAQLEICRVMGRQRYKYHELAAATNNFAGDNRIGRGGSGSVYRGYLRDQDCHVAIKVLSGQQLKEFEAEVNVMTQLKHKNIFQLVGWCKSRRKGLFLVYELVTQGSLDKHLYDVPDKTLTWEQRYKILLGLGSALQYLHQDCEKCVVHGDIKRANVMLDASHNAKLGDFGLARLIDHGAEPRTTQDIAGTLGYMDPLFINNGWRCTELDVYSFGVVLLEIACGKKPASRQANEAPRLLAWVLNLYHDQSSFLDAADPKLNGEFDRQQMERVLVTGLWCAHPNPSQRPSIAEAMDFLRSPDLKLPVIPARPDAEQIRLLEAQAFGDVTVDYQSAHAVDATTYHTSTDSASLHAEE